MEFKNYKTVSAEIRKQIDDVCEIWQRHMGEELLGVYIHGSMALQCFRESISDIDMLIVTGRKIARTERLSIAS